MSTIPVGRQRLKQLGIFDVMMQSLLDPCRWIFTFLLVVKTSLRSNPGMAGWSEWPSSSLLLALGSRNVAASLVEAPILSTNTVLYCTSTCSEFNYQILSINASLSGNINRLPMGSPLIEGQLEWSSKKTHKSASIATWNRLGEMEKMRTAWTHKKNAIQPACNMLITCKRHCSKLNRNGMRRNPQQV